LEVFADAGRRRRFGKLRSRDEPAGLWEHLMILKLILDEQIFELNVPDTLVAQAGDFFAKMDRDMDNGWQMGREWVEHPDRLQRCQIVADKLLTALETENHDLGRLMAGYIVARVPEIDSVEPDPGGEPQNTLFTFREHAAAAPAAAAPADPAPSAGNPRLQALAQAGQEVSKVFRAGRHWKFSVLNPASGQWEESPAIGDQEQAENLRELAIKQRYRELCGEG
jgi:hypothetical protein